MARQQKLFLSLFLQVVACALTGLADDVPLAQRPWVEVSTAHFNFYSCGPIGNVYKLAARLEQFSSAYAQLAGTQAVAWSARACVSAISAGGYRPSAI